MGLAGSAVEGSKGGVTQYMSPSVWTPRTCRHPCIGFFRLSRTRHSKDKIQGNSRCREKDSHIVIVYERISTMSTVPRTHLPN